MSIPLPIRIRTSLLLIAGLLCLAPALQGQLTDATDSIDSAWWKHAVIYEIYPRSFQDSNGDGIGDLNGITHRLDYLQHVGVDAIWIAPMYPSPQVDFGYDISNYTAVDPQYGTLADFDRLLAAAKTHHIRIVLDMVLNHTSDKHPWFVDSASSRTNPHADWYIWNDGKPDPTNGKARNAHRGPKGWVVPPNNWSSIFQGSTWEWVESRQQFYYHFFYKQQPDLNWRNPAVEKAMFDSMRFWLDRGVAGFRLDAIDTLFEDSELRDESLLGHNDASGFPATGYERTSNLPEVHDVLRRMRTMIDSYPRAAWPNDRVLIGETYTANTAELLHWYGTPTHPELQLPMDTLVGFHQEGDSFTTAPVGALNLVYFRKYLTEMQTELAGNRPLLVFDNHDNPRSWDRYTTPAQSSAEKLAIAKLIATVLLASRSDALMYYGQELGMTTETPKRKQDVRDPIGITGWPAEKGRDGERTPMQWTAAPLAGFTTNRDPWLPIPPNHNTINVASETAKPDSLLRWYRQLIALRRSNPALRDGTTTFLDNSNPSVLSYARIAPAGSKTVLISMNMTAESQTVHLDLASTGIHGTHLYALLFDAPDSAATMDATSFTLPPFTSLIAEVR